MKKLNRRQFLKGTVALGAATLTATATQAEAAPKNVLSPDRMGVLVDTTACVGCRQCEFACKKAHDLPTGNLESYSDRSVFNTMRRPSDTALTVVNEFRSGKDDALPTNVKVQCMHCDHPACVSACIVGAFTKEENGSVIWATEKCIGCRYCMVACPFQVPAFEYQKALQPLIAKCDFCFNRTKEGKLPACVGTCPVEALTYGPRNEIIRVAREKIRREPERYRTHIFGEHEVAGTSWMYLATNDFTELGFPKLHNKSAPGVSESIQHGIFASYFPPVFYYSLIGSVMWLSKKRHAADESEHHKEDGHE
ncbi:4Fe-4S dicluster domain-containing protein [Geomonas sp. RF6]|uniref:4Fe-4S dicluster domain-containing protein n=1 Tax=Geomonas sp. RF6 TaxID=2897342 RepID=UPI001E5154DF|nr:4Fe-4S dicluster domain-containing protein [Geomonas sp. RF6]UFS69427.1 4Fe-4S dicluster domain-containing protein [Geomonas sp. RF6]